MMQDNNDMSSEIKGGDMEGRHLKLLNKALQQTTSKSMTAFKLQVILQQLPVLLESRPDDVKRQHQNFVTETQQAIQNAHQSTIHEAAVDQSLNTLDKIIGESPRDIDKPAWRPSSTVTDNLLAHELPIKMKLRDKLVAMVRDAEQEEEQLRQTVAAHRRQLASADRRLTDTCDAHKITGSVKEDLEEFLINYQTSYTESSANRHEAG